MSAKCLRRMAVAATIGALTFSSVAQAQVSSKESGNLEQTHGFWRSSNLDGATVYNDKGDGVATIKDLLIDPEGRVKDVVLSVGSFIGVSKKYVEIPFSSLIFKSTRPGPEGAEKNGAGAVGNAVDYSIVLPSVTKDKLNSMPDFDYNK